MEKKMKNGIRKKGKGKKPLPCCERVRRGG
jgi:hypothetical protein